MIHLFTGENSYEVQHEVQKYIVRFDGEPERYDGENISLAQLPDLFAGQTLFSLKRLIILTQLSSNASLWSVLPEWVGRMSVDTEMILIEPKPDKRTSTYKWLKANAETYDFPAYTIRDRSTVEKWLRAEADARGMSLAPNLVRMIVDRAGVNQWELTHVLDKLELSDGVDEATIRSVVDQRPEESVFALFETAMRGDAARISELIAELRRTEDAYRVFGLLSSQAIQLYALTLGVKDDRNVAKDFGAAPFALTKLRPYAVRLSRANLSQIASLFAAADMKLKTSQAEPWLVVENLLLHIAAER